MNFTITFIITLHMIGHGTIGHKPLIALEIGKPLGPSAVIVFKKGKRKNNEKLLFQITVIYNGNNNNELLLQIGNYSANTIQYNVEVTNSVTDVTLFIYSIYIIII